MNKIILSLSALLLATLTVSAQTKTNERDFQISFISPFGTNGVDSHLISNKYSVNILGGYSAGNSILELGSLYNVNTDFTKGAQFAGITNYTGKSDKALQFAGILNISTSGESMFQAAGIANIADKVNGVQLGLVNIANSYENGLPIGLINIVKENGKQEFELSFSEALNTALSFKLGTDRLYTIFSAGINYIEQPVNYAVGLGFGTHIDWNNGWANQIEAIGYALTEDSSFDTELNMLTQLKFTISKNIDKHFKFFAGPVLNMTISKYENPETGELGSSLKPWTLWENKSDKTRLNAWIGFTAGIRF